ncbi:MAG TPA: AbrB/MazE/SpoVT family DNA-binding domain-containing protein [Sphaerochaeta sp.]|jgi:AbrB family looped-hinge helix DNA binding protein|nr:AbrB/MazE/SpoVT family DNA-binding domain-containing protein [Sphaerochaeta sp.]
MTQKFVDNAKVMAKGQVTIPKDVRAALGVGTGDRVTFLVDGSSVRMINSALFAMEILQTQMAGEAQKAGLKDDEDVMALVKNLRSEDTE